MACRNIVFHSVLLTEPWRPILLSRTSFSASFRIHGSLAPRLSGKFRSSGARGFHLSCCHKENPESSSSEDEQGPPQEVVLKAISGFSLRPIFQIFISVLPFKFCSSIFRGSYMVVVRNGLLFVFELLIIILDSQRCLRRKGELGKRRMWLLEEL